MTTCVQLALSNPVPGREDEYNRWYDQEHLLHGVLTPGMLAGQRFRRAAGPWPSGRHDYLALYELDDPTRALAALARARGTDAMPISPAIDMTTVQPPILWRRATVYGVAARLARDRHDDATVVLLLAAAANGDDAAFASALLRGGLADLADLPGVARAELLTLAEQQIRGSARKYPCAVLIDLHDDARALAALADRLPALPHLDRERWLATVFRPIGPRLTKEQAERRLAAAAPAAPGDAGQRKDVPP
jgi:hypothetical protein